MTGYIDIAKINQRKSELQAELVKLESLMELIENFARPAEPPQAVTPTPPTQLSMPMAAYNVQEPKRGFTAGLRRAVILPRWDNARAMWRCSDDSYVSEFKMAVEHCINGTHRYNAVQVTYGKALK